MDALPLFSPLQVICVILELDTSGGHGFEVQKVNCEAFVIINVAPVLSIKRMGNAVGGGTFVPEL